MQRSRGKVEFEDLREGDGEVATRGHKARVSGTINLHRGDCLQRLDGYWIDLKRRGGAVAGVRYGLEGMRVGGIRRIVVPPHLAYGEQGAPAAKIPPNAMLICELELLELEPTHPIPPKLKLARERKANQSKP